MAKEQPPTADAFFSGPFEPAETRRLLDLIDSRLSLRASLNLPVRPVSVELDGQDMQAPLLPHPADSLDADSLGELTAPLFNVRKAGRLGRAGRVLLNLPLRIFGRPQLYFNAELRRIITTWTEVVRTVVDVQAALCREVNVLRQLRDPTQERATDIDLRALEGRLQAVEARLERLARELARIAPPGP